MVVTDYSLTRHPEVSDEFHLEMLARWAASEAEAWITTPRTDTDKATHRYRTLLLRWAISQIAEEWAGLGPPKPGSLPDAQRATAPRGNRMIKMNPCARCGHPADWHRHNDESLANVDGHNSHGVIENDPNDPNECPFRCIGYDCEAPGPPPSKNVACPCADYEHSPDYD